MALFFLHLLFFLSGFPLFPRICLPSLSSAVVVDSGNSPPISDQLRKLVLLRRHRLPVATADAIATNANSLELLARVLVAMEDGLGFMESAENDLNLDAIIGSRIVEGQLTVLLTRLEDEDDLNLPLEIVDRIRQIRHLADKISSNAIPSIKQKQPVYYGRLSVILRRGFWALSYSTREANVTDVVSPVVSGEAMDEEQSDDCLTELFGTSGKTTEQCRVSLDCWKLMTQQGFQHYALTHQVFYTEIGTSFGCFTGDVKRLTDRLSFGFCANILVEAETIAAAGFPYDKTDLFMEQAALCGVLGFVDFFRPHWLEAILLWQRHREGCWGEDENSQSPRARRFRREERVLPGGCRCHRTAVALGALVGYVRFLSETISSQNSSVKYQQHQ